MSDHVIRSPFVENSAIWIPGSVTLDGVSRIFVPAWTPDDIVDRAREMIEEYDRQEGQLLQLAILTALLKEDK